MTRFRSFLSVGVFVLTLIIVGTIGIPKADALNQCQALCASWCGYNYVAQCSCRSSVLCCPRSNQVYLAHCETASGLEQCDTGDCGECVGQVCPH